MGCAVKQGDVYWYTFRAPDKRRPVLILTRDSAIPYLNGLTVAPITTHIRDIPTEVVLTPADGMPADCASTWTTSRPSGKRGSATTSLTFRPR